MKKQPNTLNNVTLIPARGPWNTKSEGQLNVLFNLDTLTLSNFLSYDSLLSKEEADIRGLRMYHLSKLKKGSVGAREWHKVRTEIVTVTKGRVLWSLKDMNGNEAEYELAPFTKSLVIPPRIMHTYTVLQDTSEIIVLANTLYNPDDASTHDTYPETSFSSTIN